MLLSNFYDQLPNLLKDYNTIANSNLPSFFPKQHTQDRYLFCILLRIFLGILLISNILSDKYILILVILILIIFGYKFYKIYTNKKNIWKNYLRNNLIYFIILILQLLKVDNKNQLSGLLIIFDALMGQQSRYITTNMPRSSPN